MEAYLNGSFIPQETATIRIDDRGFQFAEGVYEVIHVYAGKPFQMRRHMARLERSLEDLDIDLGMSTDELAELSLELVRRNGLRDALVYIQISTGAAPRAHLRPAGLKPTVIVLTTPFPPASETWPAHGIRCMTVSDNRWSGCYVKTTMLLPNTIAKRNAVNAGFDEAIFVRDGYAAEATSSNLFAVFGEELWTPPASNYILGGITRDVVLDLAADLGIPARERPIPVQRLLRADELFLTASGAELAAVASVDDRTIGAGVAGPILSRLRSAFRKLTLEGS